MSHFSTLVIGPDPEFQLAPFHEFECTGRADEFVQSIDETAEAREEYEKSTVTKYRSPEGFTEVKVPQKEEQTFAEFVEDYYGRAVVPHGEEPDLEDEHKYGYCTVDADGQVIAVVRRTNPRKKWDWWTVGGRYSDRLLLKTGEPADSARVCDVDWGAMKEKRKTEAIERYDKAMAVLAPHLPFRSWEEVRGDRTGEALEAARQKYRDQPAVKAYEGWEGPDEFLVSREDYIAAAEDRTFSFFALVKDRVWSESGSMGWFGMVSDEKEQAQWNQFCRDTIKALLQDAPETLITVVDCHI